MIAEAYIPTINNIPQLQRQLNAIFAAIYGGINVGTLRWYGDLADAPSASQELFAIEMTGDEHLPAGLPDNLGSVAVAPTGPVTFLLKVNGVNIGSMNVAALATAATWTMAADYDATAGDILAFYAPASVDLTLSGPRYTFVGSRS